MTASTGVLNVGIEDLEKANEDMREKVKLSQKNPFFLQAILDELERLKFVGRTQTRRKSLFQ